MLAYLNIYQQAVKSLIPFNMSFINHSEQHQFRIQHQTDWTRKVNVIKSHRNALFISQAVLKRFSGLVQTQANFDVSFHILFWFEQKIMFVSFFDGRLVVGDMQKKHNFLLQSKVKSKQNIAIC